MIGYIYNYRKLEIGQTLDIYYLCRKGLVVFGNVLDMCHTSGLFQPEHYRKYEIATDKCGYATVTREILPGEFAQMSTGVCTDRYGAKRRYQNGLLHHHCLPSIIYTTGDKQWYISGELHRDDGPAMIRTDGTKEWLQDGALHREDGPAVVYADGTREWHINGMQIEPF